MPGIATSNCPFSFSVWRVAFMAYRNNFRELMECRWPIAAHNLMTSRVSYGVDLSTVDAY